MASLAIVRSRASAIVALIVAVALAFWPSCAELITFWTDLESRGGTHGLLLLGVSVWMIYDRRDAIGSAPARGSWLALVALAGCGLAWVVLWKAGLGDPHILLLPAIAWLAVLAACGFAVARLVMLPIGFLVFALPAWGHLAGALQALTVHAVGLLCALTGLPVYIEGDFIHIRSGVFEVAGGCSGVHFLVVALAIGTLKAYLDEATLRRGALLVLAMGLLALLSNWIRVYTIVVAGYATDMKHWLVTVDHYWFGWVLFAIMLTASLWILGRFFPAPSLPRTPAMPATPAVAAPFSRSYFLAMLAVLAPPLSAYALDSTRSATGAGKLVTMPVAPAGWSESFAAESGNWKPVFHGATFMQQKTYESSSGPGVELLVVLYDEQRPGAELITEGNSLLGNRLTADASRARQWSGGRVRETVAADGDGRQSIVWSWYGIDGRTFVDPLYSQLWYGLRSTIDRPFAYLVAARAECGNSCEGARQALDRFLHSTQRTIEAAVVNRHDAHSAEAEHGT